MLEAPREVRAVTSDLGSRRQIALERVDHLITDSQERARRAWRNYARLQGLTIGLAAITPCLIVLAKESPGNPLFNWLQLFVPAFAAISAGLTHVFRWREDAVRLTSLAESIRSQLWRFQTRSGEFGGGLTDEQALDTLVVQVDALNLQALARWSSAQLAEATPASTAHPQPAAGGAER